MALLKPKYKPTELNGYVKFNIPEVSHAAVGTVTVSGKFRRIKPNCVRSEVDPLIIDAMAGKLTAWAEEYGIKDEHFERYSVKAIVVTVIEFCVYIYPNVPLDSKRMQYFILSSCCELFFDDVLEEAWFEGKLHKGNIQKLSHMYTTYMKIMRNQAIDDPTPEYPELPAFKPICKCLQYAVDVGIELAGDDYQEAVEPFAAAFQTVQECNEWFTVSRLNERYSLSTFRIWRMINATGHAIIEGPAFADKVRLRPEIRNHPAFLHMVHIMMSYFQKANDLLGVKKDFEYKGGDPDSEIVFRVVWKGDPIELVVQETCDSMDELLQDLVLVKQALIDIFGEGENLLRYLDKIDNMIDGPNQVYVQNFRYRLRRGAVELTREDMIQEEEED